MSLALIFLVSWLAAAQAEIYQWTDETGSVHFTDSPHNVPPEYRGQLRTRSERDPTLPRAPQLPPSGQKPSRNVQLERREFGYVVQARLNGSLNCRLVVDTGATSTVISPRVIEQLGVEVQKAPGVVLHTANGQVQAGWAQIESLEVGGNRVGPLRVVVHDSLEAADGLLGMNFLSAFHVEIRPDGPTLLLSPP